ncbi:MAG: hypothetical protein J1F37_02225 [Oscillospiraceae bacterium]|nr:hypothetical protein [Oscillospiraceae bacterium]
MNECKRCLLRESAEKDVYEDIQSRIAKLSEKDKTDSGAYRLRLENCKECEHLISGVCMKCGCYVELRAAFKKQHCPLPSTDKKW